MIIPDYREFQNSNEIYHYGIPRRSGRYPYGSGDRPYQSTGGRREERIRKVEGRTSRRFDRIDRKLNRAQNRANVYFQKSIRKETSRFKKRRESAKKDFDKGAEYQKKANALSYKGSKYFKSYQRFARRLDIDMNEDLKKRGLKYMDDVVMASKSSYQLALARKI